MDGEKVARAILDYRGDDIELLAGENMVGRGLDCRIRFNDPTISRRHLRLMVDPDGVMLEDLDSRNGTKVNGQRVRGHHPLEDDDTVQIGNRTLGIRVITELDAESGMYEETISDWQALDRMQHEPSGGMPAIRPDASIQGTPTLPSQQTCPRCRAAVPMLDEICPQCSYRWPPGRPMSETVQIPAVHERRRDPRTPIEIPVIYSSQTLTCDATAADLSCTGVFLLTQLLDNVDTPCRVTLLPDGGQAVSVAGIVRRLVEPGESEGYARGMGIEFSQMSQASEEALSGLTT